MSNKGALSFHNLDEVVDGGTSCSSYSFLKINLQESVRFAGGISKANP